MAAIWSTVVRLAIEALGAARPDLAKCIEKHRAGIEKLARKEDESATPLPLVDPNGLAESLWFRARDLTAWPPRRELDRTTARVIRDLLPSFVDALWDGLHAQGLVDRSAASFAAPSAAATLNSFLWSLA